VLTEGLSRAANQQKSWYDPPVLDKGDVTMSAIAYSYLRFSTSDQANGDSRRRQVAMAEKYAVEHHLTLDRSLPFVISV
jgi:hypothetical protein